MPSSGLQLDEWLARLETYSPQEIDLGLERVDVLLQRLNLSLPRTVLHIAGTNGKGSSVALLEALLLTTGDAVGSYTSPHLHHYNERIRVDGVEATDAQIVAAFEKVDAQRQDVPLTYFEFGTLAALVVFAERNVDIAILEVGLGGRLDAVNAVEPTASLISNISLDHCEWLGNDVEAIAYEKAGVMRANKAVVFAAKDMPQAIEEAAKSKQAKLLAATRDYHWSLDGTQWSWSGCDHSLHGLVRPMLAGDIQIQNAAGVLMLLEATGFASLLDAELVNVALANTSLPGRAQVVEQRFVLDVAHNPGAATALASTIAGLADGRAAVTILGMLDDKDVAGVVGPLDPITGHWIAVTADSARALDAAEVARRVAIATDRPCWIADSMSQAIDRATELAGASGQILITGSFYTVGAALVILAAPGYEYG